MLRSGEFKTCSTFQANSTTPPDKLTDTRQEKQKVVTGFVNIDMFIPPFPSARGEHNQVVNTKFTSPVKEIRKAEKWRNVTADLNGRGNVSLSEDTFGWLSFPNWVTSSSTMKMAPVATWILNGFMFTFMRPGVMCLLSRLHSGHAQHCCYQNWRRNLNCDIFVKLSSIVVKVQGGTTPQ